MPMQSAGQEEISLRQLSQGKNAVCVPPGSALRSHVLPQPLRWSLHNLRLDSQLDKISRASSAGARVPSAQSSSSTGPQQRGAFICNETTVPHSRACGKLWKWCNKNAYEFLVWEKICILNLLFFLCLPVILFLFLPVEQWAQ